VAYAVNKQEVIKAAYWGLGETCNNQPFLNRSRMYIPVKDREVSFAKARQLLAEAGYPNGFKTEMATHTESAVVDACNIIAGHLRNIGIEATIRTMDTVTWYTTLKKGDYSISTGSDSERLDPDDSYFNRFHSSEIGANNISRYSSKEMDHFLEHGRTDWRWKDRMASYKKVVEQNAEDLAILYISKSIQPIAYRDYVKGHGAGMSTWFSYYRGGLKKVWLDK
jgi:peptide/nickel transport system substrate-binding protein